MLRFLILAVNHIESKRERRNNHIEVYNGKFVYLYGVGNFIFPKVGKFPFPRLGKFTFRKVWIFLFPHMGEKNFLGVGKFP